MADRKFTELHNATLVINQLDPKAARFTEIMSFLLRSRVKVFVARLWKQTISNNPDVTASIDMVLIDEKGTRIQATVKRNLINQFDALLADGTVRVLSKFGVAENTGRFLLTTHPCKINFYRQTTVRMSNDWDGPKQSFALHSFNDIISPDFDSKYSFDVIGEVVHCDNTKIMTTNGKERRVKTLQLLNEEGKQVKCSIWDGHANKLDSFLSGPGRNESRVIILIQFARLSEWGISWPIDEQQFSNSLFGSKVLINEDLPEFDEFKKRVAGVSTESTADKLLSSGTVETNPIEYWVEDELKKLDELMDMTKATKCVVVGTVINIQSEYGWAYHACVKCTKKVRRFYQLVDENTDDEGKARFECGDCCIITDVFPKLKVHVRLQDATGSMSFVMFEKDVTTFLNRSVAQLIKNAREGEDGDNLTIEFRPFIGARFAFKIKVSDYNIRNKYYVYTVNRICDDEDIIECILKNPGGEEDSPNDVDSQLPSPLPSKSSVSAKDAVSGTGENSTPVESIKSTASSPPPKKSVGDDQEFGINGSATKDRPNVHKMKIPKLDKF